MSCVAGGRFKKEVVIDGQSYLLLIRDEGGPPEMQVSTMRAMGGEGKKEGGGGLWVLPRCWSVTIRVH